MKKKKVFSVILLFFLALGLVSCINGVSSGDTNTSPPASSDTDTSTPNPNILTGTITLDNTKPEVGSKIKATYTGNGTGAESWVWLLGRDYIISGATSNSYTVVAADQGRTLIARVSFANQTGTISSLPTAEVIDGESLYKVSGTYYQEGDNNVHYTFNSDGSVIYVFWQYTYTGTYTVQGSKLINIYTTEDIKGYPREQGGPSELNTVYAFTIVDDYTIRDRFSYNYNKQ